MFDTNRLNELREKFPRAALELDLVSGRVSPETGLVDPSHESDNMQNMMELCVLEVLALIDKQGHSGFSHGYMMGLLIPLLKDYPITPLTGADWEWKECQFVKGDYQNKRCPSVFKEDGVAYNTKTYGFTEESGVSFSCRESHKEISFPITSKELETKFLKCRWERFDHEEAVAIANDDSVIVLEERNRNEDGVELKIARLK